MSAITKEDLSRWADELATEHWGVEYTGVIELKNRRWKRRMASICLSTPVPAIRMCTKVNAERTEEEVKGILLHELVHWRLYSLGMRYCDRDEEFVKEAMRVGAPISGTVVARKAHERYRKTGL